MSTATARQHSARARAETRKRARRRQILTIAGSAVAVVAVVIVVVLVGVLGGNNSTGTSKHVSGDRALAAVAAVPASALDRIGAGTASDLPRAVKDQPLTSDGKPLVLYVGAEYCPFCAAERWPFVQALSRFGTFDNLDLTTSASNDVHPNTPSFTFSGATYTSDYLTFVGKELYTNNVVGDGYEPLDTLTPQEQQLFDSHTQGFPFIDLGGAFIVNGATYDPRVIDGLTAQEIADAMSDPTGPVAQAIDGAANAFTAALCRLTDGQPADVCTAPGVTAVARSLGR